MTDDKPQDVLSFDEDKLNKCALKLLGLDSAVLSDEAILEFISHYVEPSAIKALFYDFFNNFYVLHLSSIDFTCTLIGRTLKFGSHEVQFLPLLECFVVKNVYPSLTNRDLREIFGAFGNVFSVSKNHVLPNSSKFFHVLSGTCKISFLLQGDDAEVCIPTNVMHPPYTFHVKKLCVGCLTENHSLLNCPDREQENVQSYDVIDISKDSDSFNFESIFVKEEPDSPNKTVLNKGLESISGHTITEITNLENTKQLLEKCPNPSSASTFLTASAVESTIEKHSDKLPEKFTNASNVSDDCERAEEGVSLSHVEEWNMREGNHVQQPRRNSQAIGIRKINFVLSPALECYIKKVKGVLCSEDLIGLIYVDARKKKDIFSYLSKITPDFKAVVSQLKEIRRELYDQRLDYYGKKLDRKLQQLIQILKKNIAKQHCKAVKDVTWVPMSL